MRKNWLWTSAHSSQLDRKLTAKSSLCSRQLSHRHWLVQGNQLLTLFWTRIKLDAKKLKSAKWGGSHIGIHCFKHQFGLLLQWNQLLSKNSLFAGKIDFQLQFDNELWKGKVLKGLTFWISFGSKKINYNVQSNIFQKVCISIFINFCFWEIFWQIFKWCFPCSAIIFWNANFWLVFI